MKIHFKSYSPLPRHRGNIYLNGMGAGGGRGWAEANQNNVAGERGWVP